MTDMVSCPLISPLAFRGRHDGPPHFDRPLAIIFPFSGREDQVALTVERHYIAPGKPMQNGCPECNASQPFDPSATSAHVVAAAMSGEFFLHR